MPFPPSHTQVAIIGAGISGLATAFYLERAGIEVAVFEASDRVGGEIRTEVVQGATIEIGPQSLRGAGASVARLVSAVGLRSEVVESHPSARKRYLIHGGKLAPMPSRLVDTLAGGPIRRRALLRALLEPFAPPSESPDETIDAFVRRRFGRGIAQPALDAFVAGIYAGDSANLEARAAFPSMVEAEEQHGSVLLSQFRRPKTDRPDNFPRGSFSFKEGTVALPNALASALRGKIFNNVPAQTIVSNGNGAVVHHLLGTCQAEHVVLSTRPEVTARIAPTWSELQTIPAAPVAAVHLAWPKGSGPAVSGFGWLAPSRERRDVLGAIWVSSTFPSLSGPWDLIRVMVGGARAPFLTDLDERALTRHATDVLRQVQGPFDPPAWTHVAKHIPGIPQYIPGHSRLCEGLNAKEPRLHMIGWGTSGIGLSQGLAAAEQLAAEIERSLR